MRVRYAPRARNDMVHIHQYVAAQSEGGYCSCAQDSGDCQPAGTLPRPRIDDVRVIGAGRYPYLVYYRMHDDAVTIIHVREARRDAPPSGSLR